MGAQLYDMERVEVLKGPQSALFGRNTNGGAVNYFSRKPSMESEGYVNLDTGKFEKRKLEGAYGGQISENMAARVSFVSNQQNEGWVSIERQATNKVKLTSRRLDFSYFGKKMTPLCYLR